ncbi:hypothetical protein KKB99_03050, partial [bacterium]|nr:hypothetical protein [bacterium]MBU1024967.1 hypothetical protein [bacterium]
MSKSKVLFRVDGGPKLGMGHIMRCLRLAQEIQKKQLCEITFATQTPEHLQPHLKNYIPSADLMSFGQDDFSSILDFYSQLNPHVIISDLNLREKIDDYMKSVGRYPLHVNIHEMHFNHFNFGLIIFASILPVRKKCACESKAEYLKGSKYVLVDSRLHSLIPPQFSADKPVRILISPGGADPEMITEKILSILKQCKIDKESFEINLVIGSANPRKDEIKTLADSIPDVSLFESPKDLFDLIEQSEIVITNGGTTVYESLAAGRLTWVISQNEFEDEV